MNWTELSEDIHQYPIQSKSLPYVDFEQPDQNFVNKYFDKVYCINLAKREKKWESVKKRFDERDIIVDRFDAIDGKILLDQNGLTKNELGCISSHLTVIQDANNKGYNKILIFEDDVHFSNDFKTRIQLIKNLDWKLLYLGGSQYKWDGIDISENFYPSNNTLGTFAYAVDSEIYEDLISAFSKKTAPADALLASVQEKNKGKCFTIYPNIVIADVTTSDIRPPRNLNTHAEKMKWN
jgi:GR25 family glycosyltransferase involved in LPS biosynthesis